MPKPSNPGVPLGTEIVYIGRPFGGWASNPPSVNAAPHYGASVEGVQGALNKQQANQYAESDGITLFRPEHFGHISAAEIYSSLTNANIDDLPLNGGMTSNSTDGVVVLNNGRLVQIEASGNTYVTSYLPTSHTPISSTSKNNDSLIFRDLASTPVEYAVWSWEYSGGADISVIQASNLSSGSTDGWYSGISSPTAPHALTQGYPHKLCKGPDGNIYVTDKSYVQQVVVNGAIASATTGNLLNVGAGWIVTGIVSYKDYVAIIASDKNANAQRGSTRVFLWNGQTSTVNGVTSTAAQYVFDVLDNFGQGVFFDGETLYVLTSGRNGSSKIWEFTGKAFKLAFESGLIPGGTTPLQGALESYQGGLMIGGIKNSQAHMFRLYGSGFHDEGNITDGANQTTDIGMVKNLYSNQLLVGVKYGSTFAIFNRTSNTYQPNATLRTILFTEGILGRRQYPLGFKGSVNRIMLYLSQWGTGASLKLSLFKDYSAYNGAGNDLLNLTIDTDTATVNNINHKAYPVGTTEIDISDISIADISTFYMIITFNHASASNVAAMIRDMVVFWAPSQ